MSDSEIRRDIRRKPATWLFVVASISTLVSVFLIGDAFGAVTPNARDHRFDTAFANCVQIATEKFPDGYYREDLDHHYDAEGMCYLVASYMGGTAFSESWNDPVFLTNAIEMGFDRVD